MQSVELTQWLLRFLDQVPVKPHSLVKLAIENAIGLLQNISLKTQGVEKIAHHHKNALEILRVLMERTSINCDSPEDSLTLMAVTYALSVMYQLTTRKIGRNLAA